MDAQLIFALIMGVVGGAVSLAVVLLVASALTPEDKPKKKTERKPIAIASELTKKALHIERVGEIRYLCSLGMTQRCIAKRLGMHQKSVWRIMKKYGIKKA